MHVQQARAWDWLMTLGSLTDPEQPFTRRSFTERFLQGREWLAAQMQALGMVTRIDSAGNLIGRLEGLEPGAETILIGSHSDSVPNGGRFDGMAGIIAGLECVASWQARGIRLNHAIEVVDYLAEEPSEWGISCIGSRGLTGQLSDELLATVHPQTQETLAAAIRRMGGQPELRSCRLDVAAAFELHIEQGRVLEQEQLDIGIVTGIVGILRLVLRFVGHAGHAGTTPMAHRQDAFVAAARTHYQATLAARELSRHSDHYLTATCGQVLVHPNASNVVPGRCELVFDIRSDDRATMEHYAQILSELAEQAATDEGGKLESLVRMTDTVPTLCDPRLMDLLKAAAELHGCKARPMPSGAGHDSAFLALIAPVAMVFVPSLGGLSHRPDEWTSPEQLVKGIEVLMAAIEAFDQQSAVKHHSVV